MVGRAEFAYLIAQEAWVAGLLKDRLFAIVLWAPIVAPLAFKLVLKRYLAQKDRQVKEADVRKSVVHADMQLSHTAEINKLVREKNHGWMYRPDSAYRFMVTYPQDVNLLPALDAKLDSLGLQATYARRQTD